MNRSQGGIPIAGKRYIVEKEIHVYETDVPSQHLGWGLQMGSKKFRVLWSGKVKQSVP